MNVFSTILDTLDNKQITIPNSKMSQGPIINYTRNDKRRVDIIISVDYTSDIDKVKRVISGIINAHEKIISGSEPTIRVLKLGSSSIDFTVRVWVNTPDYFDVFFDLNEDIKKALDNNNIIIPYPHVTVLTKDVST